MPRTGACQESGHCTTQQDVSALMGEPGLETQILIYPYKERSWSLVQLTRSLQNVVR